MKTFEKFFPDLLPQVPGCPEPVAEQALKRAAQRFCELTFAWRVRLDAISLAAGTDEYELPLPERSELVRIEIARRGTCDIAVATQNDARRDMDYVECYDGRTVIVNPVPAATADLFLTCTLKPGDTATGVEDFIHAQYSMLIADGAAGLLKQHPLKTYSNADGTIKWADFESRCRSVKQKLWRGNARNTPRAVPNWY